MSKNIKLVIGFVFLVVGIIGVAIFVPRMFEAQEEVRLAQIEYDQSHAELDSLTRDCIDANTIDDCLAQCSEIAEDVQRECYNSIHRVTDEDNLT